MRALTLLLHSLPCKPAQLFYVLFGLLLAFRMHD